MRTGGGWVRQKKNKSTCGQEDQLDKKTKKHLRSGGWVINKPIQEQLKPGGWVGQTRTEALAARRMCLAIKNKSTCDQEDRFESTCGQEDFYSCKKKSTCGQGEDVLDKNKTKAPALLLSMSLFLSLYLPISFVISLSVSSKTRWEIVSLLVCLFFPRAATYSSERTAINSEQCPLKHTGDHAHIASTSLRLGLLV